MKHTSRRSAVPPMLKQEVWKKYMPSPKLTHGPCYVCGNEISILVFECGHNVAHADVGEITLENLRPICSSCNRSMGTRN